ncbi:hypothetical protein G7046_g7838 [Stylonectria norvegica]|nr:hypothetical protein G7046_g7838 [Stylonectria norvegica]
MLGPLDGLAEPSTKSSVVCSAKLMGRTDEVARMGNAREAGLRDEVDDVEAKAIRCHGTKPERTKYAKHEHGQGTRELGVEASPVEETNGQSTAYSRINSIVLETSGPLAATTKGPMVPGSWWYWDTAAMLVRGGHGHELGHERGHGHGEPRGKMTPENQDGQYTIHGAGAPVCGVVLVCPVDFFTPSPGQRPWLDCLTEDQTGSWGGIALCSCTRARIHGSADDDTCVLLNRLCVRIVSAKHNSRPYAEPSILGIRSVGTRVAAMVISRYRPGLPFSNTIHVHGVLDDHQASVQRFGNTLQGSGETPCPALTQPDGFRGVWLDRVRTVTDVEGVMRSSDANRVTEQNVRNATTTTYRT